MGAKTAVGWTGKTWGPWFGCFKLSPGCKGCYMYRDQERYGNDPKEIRRSKTTFYDPIKWAKKPENWGCKIFVCSWSDFWLPEADEWRADAWEIIKATPQFAYQILTKRPENILDRLPADWGEGYSNVWLGVSAENQEYADKRIPVLLDIPAPVHFVSYEPALGPIFFRTEWMNDRNCAPLNWIIWGGESGPAARTADPEWARRTQERCREWDVAFFLKQLGSQPGEPWQRTYAHEEAMLDGKTYTEFPVWNPPAMEF